MDDSCQLDFMKVLFPENPQPVKKPVKETPKPLPKSSNELTMAKQNLADWVARRKAWLARPRVRQNSQNWEKFEEEVKEFITIYDGWRAATNDGAENFLRQLVGVSQILVIRVLGRYRSACGLVDNLNPHRSENLHVVEPVRDGWFGGCNGNVEDYEGYTSSLLDEVLALQKWTCVLADVEPVSRKWLCDHLADGKDYNSYRKRIRTRVRRPVDYPAVSMKELPPRKSRKK